MKPSGAIALTGITTLVLLGIFGCSAPTEPQEPTRDDRAVAAAAEPAPAVTVVEEAPPPAVAELPTPAIATPPPPVAEPDHRYAPIPRTGACPSVVSHPIADGPLVLGDFRLTTSRPPIVDGDTVRVDGLDESLRLLGIDTEETFKDEGQRALAERDWSAYLATVYAEADANHPPKYGTPMGEAAREFAEWFFEGVREVRLESDAPTRTRGYFGRHLVYVLAERGGRLVNYNVETVRQGFSPYFVKYGRSARYHDAFTEAEREARAARRGIWASPAEHACYPDYAVRLAWWADCDRAILRLAELSARDPDVIVLGDDASWERLKALDGRDVTVAGTVTRLRTTGSMGFIHLSHRNRQDLLVVGKKEAIERHPLARETGHVVLVSGRVSLHRGEPQLAAETVSFRRF